MEKRLDPEEEADPLADPVDPPPCEHRRGWLLLREKYGALNGKYMCLAGCGETRWPEELGYTLPAQIAPDPRTIKSGTGTPARRRAELTREIIEALKQVRTREARRSDGPATRTVIHTVPTSGGDVILAAPLGAPPPSLETDGGASWITLNDDLTHTIEV